MAPLDRESHFKTAPAGPPGLSFGPADDTVISGASGETYGGKDMIRSLVTILILALNATALADSGSESGSCSGTFKFCENGHCTNEYVYIYAYQYAYIYNDFIQSENHTLNFSGALGNSSSYVLQKYVPGSHVIYRGPRFNVAIPWKSGAGIYISTGIPGPDGGWILCD
jgi:hypothetical protein